MAGLTEILPALAILGGRGLMAVGRGLAGLARGCLWLGGRWLGWALERRGWS